MWALSCRWWRRVVTMDDQAGAPTLMYRLRSTSRSRYLISRILTRPHLLSPAAGVDWPCILVAIQDNGGCNFFEWCDTPSRGLTNTQSITIYQSDSLVADMLCPCGAGTCLILTTKTGKNVGRQFYGCPANQGGGSCGFFKWCDDQQLWTAAPLQASPQYQVDVNSSSHNYSRRSSSSCFKCGQENHWAKDCPKQSLDPSDKGGITITPATSSGTCCKCGKAGHWSRDCPTLHCGAGAVSSQIKSSSLSSWKNL